MAPRAASKRAAKKTDEKAADVACDSPTEKPAKRPRKQAANADVKGLDSGGPTRGLGKAESSAEDADPDSGAGSEQEPAAFVDGANDAEKPAGRNANARAKKGKAKGKVRLGAQAGPGAAGPREPPGPKYFLMKSEPEEFSLDDLAAKSDQTSHWEGVRNAQARNIMRSMRRGDEAFFYHSSCKVPAVVGVVRVVREAYPDHFAFDKSSKYHDPSSTPESPKWWMVDVQLVRRMVRPVTLSELRQEGARGPPIQDMVLINKSRLSVQPVTAEQWRRILELERQLGSQQEQGEEEDKGKQKGKNKHKEKGQEEKDVR